MTSKITRFGSSLLVPFASFASFASFALGCASAPVVTTSTNSACRITGPERGVPFIVSEAESALVEAAMAAADCSERTAAAKGNAKVHFSPAGCVLNIELEVEGAELTQEDTNCMAKAFFAAKVEPYSGKPVAVRKTLMPTR